MVAALSLLGRKSFTFIFITCLLFLSEADISFCGQFVLLFLLGVQLVVVAAALEVGSGAVHEDHLLEDPLYHRVCEGQEEEDG
eukprot:CAMPEP_0170496812 /NCGR_PEP_ID=MMETSP0208-20121228/22766_1 /TAXON_ID=197538 /ORGANISM="Strombidium inclinatum, Strain S3" /LENGTH=82 /DNA_ID=CAMNT_0010773443 /DNA_START=1707 /DNA_END=1955 /DNA_ORIENTATION=-